MQPDFLEMSSMEETHNENVPEAHEEQTPDGEDDAAELVKEPFPSEEVLRAIVPLKDRGVSAISVGDE
jgi:U3 small nucleolar ribonucleoprotein component